MQDYTSTAIAKNIPYELTLSLPDYIEFQLRLIFENEINNFSKGELQVLSYLYLYPNVNEAIDKLLASRIRSSRKSVHNDISKFRGYSILSLDDKIVKFNPDIIIVKTPNLFSVKVKLK